MAEYVAYPTFEYSAKRGFNPPGAAGTLIYEDLFYRLLDKVIPVACPNPHLTPCWQWQGNEQYTISHKHAGMIKVSKLAYAMYLPLEFNQTHRHRKRIALKTMSRCGLFDCVRPDHHVPLCSGSYVAWVNKPRERSHRAARNEWLNYHEMTHLEGMMMVSMGDPEDLLVQYAERINLSYLTLIDVWELRRQVREMEFNQWSC